MKHLSPLLVLFLLSVGLSAQGNLQFNQVLVLNSQSGTQTVPAGKVWKITSFYTAGGVYYGNWSTNFTATWSTGSPNPCTGATSGTSSVRRIEKKRCLSGNNRVLVNGNELDMDGNKGLVWLPAATTLSINTTPCANLLSPDIPSGAPYYLNDQSDPNQSGIYYACDGAINAGPVPNTLLLTILEFNIVP